jgi:Uma2 family endonuclease
LPSYQLHYLNPCPEQAGTRVIKDLLFCLEQGSQMGWLIDPQEKLIFVYTPNQAPISFEQDNDILPVPNFAQNLQITVEQIFGWLIVS